MAGISFDELCRGERTYYSFNLVDLVETEEIEAKRKMDRDIEKLSQKLNETIQSLQRGNPDREGSTVKQYYIGKTYIRRRHKAGGGYQHFDHMNPSTWRIEGINSRYKSHSTKNYGRDGLVVLTAITRAALPTPHLRRISHEDYTLILEQRLLHHMLINELDDRVANLTFNEGNRQRRVQDNPDMDYVDSDAYAYALYMAFIRVGTYERYTQPEPHPTTYGSQSPRTIPLTPSSILPQPRYHPSIRPLQRPPPVVLPTILPEPRYHPSIRPLQRTRIT